MLQLESNGDQVSSDSRKRKREEDTSATDVTAATDVSVKEEKLTEEPETSSPKEKKKEKKEKKKKKKEKEKQEESMVTEEASKVNRSLDLLDLTHPNFSDVCNLIRNKQHTILFLYSRNR